MERVAAEPELFDVIGTDDFDDQVEDLVGEGEEVGHIGRYFLLE